MIIECINCSKKFNVDSKLIPFDGRQIQCGSCNHTWHYIIEDVSSKTLTPDNAEKPQEIKKNVNLDSTDNENLAENKSTKPLKQETDIKVESKNNGISNFFSNLLVIIISLFALLVLVDTLKTPLINIFPGLEIILFSLFETLKDIKLFIIDLT